MSVISRYKNWSRGFAVLLIVCAVLPARPAQATDDPFTETEQREILTGLEELILIKQEVEQLRAVMKKDQDEIKALRTQVSALERLVEAQDKMIATATKISDLQMKALGTYQKMVELAEKRAEAAESRAERAEKFMILGPIIGIIVGVLMVAIFL